MKNSKEIAKTVFRARDEYLESQRTRNRRIKKAAGISAISSAFLLTLIGAGYWNDVQHRLPSIQTEIPTGETLNTEIYSINETAVQNTEPTNISIAVQTETKAFSTETETQTVFTEVQTEMTEEITQPPPATEPILPTSESVVEPTTDEAVEIPQWDEKTLSERFMEFTVNGNVYHSKCSSIAEEYVGEKLYDVVVAGYDDYADEVRYADAVAYRISGISAETAVSIRFRGYDTKYVYINWNYYPENLGELMDALNLTETISFHVLTPAQGESRTEFDQSQLMNLLNNHRDLPRMEDDNFHKPLFSISTSVERLGIRNKSMKVTEDGWLTMNIMEVGYSFYIGEETAVELAETFGIVTDAPETTVPFTENTETPILE